MGARLMFPGNELSSQPVVGRFLYYYRGKLNPFIDFCKAGVALNDPSMGMDYQLWKARVYADGKVTVAPENSAYETETLITTVIGAKKVSLAFDNNMRVAVSFLVGSVLHLYWYDATVSSYVTLNVSNVRDAFARIDDVRDIAVSYRDIILSYIVDDRLCYRLSRDRFTIEYFLQDVNALQKLYQCGMTEKLRFQFALVWDAELLRVC